MRSKVSLLPTGLLISAAFVLSGCGSNSAESQGADSQGPGAPPQAPDGAKSGSNEGVKISNRTYADGNAHVKVSGFFSADGSQHLNLPASITSDGSTWLQYGASGAKDLNVLITNSEDSGENGVTIGVEAFTVTGTSTSGECKPKFEVTPTRVTGRYQCKGTTGYDKSTGQMGKVDIDVEFDASSAQK